MHEKKIGRLDRQEKKVTIALSDGIILLTIALIYVFGFSDISHYRFSSLQLLVRNNCPVAGTRLTLATWCSGEFRLETFASESSSPTLYFRPTSPQKAFFYFKASLYADHSSAP